MRFLEPHEIVGERLRDQALVYFWDQIQFSGGVLIHGAGDGLRPLMLKVLESGDVTWPPGRWAAHLCQEAAGFPDVEVVHPPMGPRDHAGAIHHRITSPTNNPGGAGVIIIDVRQQTCAIVGYGFDRDVDSNLGQVREMTLTEALSKPRRPRGSKAKS